jgi:hypothetical protein
MFARLVTGRYGHTSEGETHTAAVARTGWLRRAFAALFGRKR